MFGYFGNLVGGKSLDRADLEPVLKGVRETLIEKNVAVRPQGKAGFLVRKWCRSSLEHCLFLCGAVGRYRRQALRVRGAYGGLGDDDGDGGGGVVGLLMLA